MKTISQIYLEVLDEDTYFSEEMILKAMRIYAKEAVDECAKSLEADIEPISRAGKRIHDLEEGEDYEIGFSRESILAIKEKIDEDGI